MRRNAVGFTLIELATTVSVLAICTGVAAPSLGRFVEGQRTLAAISSLTTHMALARMAAITQRRPTVLCPSSNGEGCDAGTDWSGGWMLFLDDNGNRRRDAGEDIIRVDTDPTSRHLAVSSTSGRPSLRYLPDGRAAGSNLTISVCNRQGELLGQVIVNNMGRPRSQRPEAATPCPA